MTVTRRTTLLAGLAALSLPQMAQAAGHKVSIRNHNFTPATLKIKAGDTVTWTNRDSANHTATDTAKGFDTGILKKGKSGSVTFSKPGTYSYFCKVHPSMKAKIIVS